MSTEYSHTCDRCFQKAPGQAVFNTAKGARNWAPEGWMAVRLNEDAVRTHLHFCPDCRKEFRDLVDDFLPEGQAVIVVRDAEFRHASEGLTDGSADWT